MIGALGPKRARASPLSHLTLHCAGIWTGISLPGTSPETSTLRPRAQDPEKRSERSLAVQSGSPSPARRWALKIPLPRTSFKGLPPTIHHRVFQHSSSSRQQSLPREGQQRDYSASSTIHLQHLTLAHRAVVKPPLSPPTLVSNFCPARSPSHCLFPSLLRLRNSRPTDSRLRVRHVSSCRNRQTPSNASNTFAKPSPLPRSSIQVPASTYRSYILETRLRCLSCPTRFIDLVDRRAAPPHNRLPDATRVHSMNS